MPIFVGISLVQQIAQESYKVHFSRKSVNESLGKFKPPT
ncbi:hypothetical protein FRUB_02615 [Fimbriiglobus ruber]|uniref:Uncharacterized protein n=1 Tax=Fimbriiglobus ruber TaxID=1908690 RepID=A0A225DZ27_9BACT|nr:hypothetical protein FRUB_02615 [Fimbriiglobus ruber]